jgi:hypothetical protein
MSTVAKCGRRGWTGFFRDPSGSFRTQHFAGIVDILAHGSQTVLPPTLHPTTGEPYRWTTDPTLLDTPISDLPTIAPDIAEKLGATLKPWIASGPPPRPARAPLQQCKLSEKGRDQQRQYVEAILVHELPALAAMASNSGRNKSVFRLVCRVGRWAHHGIISRDRLTADVLAACEANGLVRDDGHRAVLATIASGLTRSVNDPLPDLGGAS